MEEQVFILYQKVFKVAKHFLDQSKYFTVYQLRLHADPSYQELAEYADKLATFLDKIAISGGWTTERVAINARQAALIMEEMSLAIVACQQEKFTEAAVRLQKMSFI